MPYDKGYQTLVHDSNVQERTYTRNLWRNIYIWVALGLAITAGVAYLTAHTPGLVSFLLPHYLLINIAAILGMIFLVTNMASRLQTMSMTAAVMSYVAYTVIEGLLLFAIFLYYPSYVLIKTFVASAAMFFGMSLYGACAKTDLSTIGKFCLMTLWGLIVATLINIFTRSVLMDYVISFVGIFAFAGLTAYDTQKIAAISHELSDGLDESSYVKISVLGALVLYIDFIGIFLHLLRLFGSRRD